MGKLFVFARTKAKDNRTKTSCGFTRYVQFFVVADKYFSNCTCTYNSTDGDPAQQKHLKVNSTRKSRSAVCVCAMILDVDGSKLRLTHPNLWSADIKKRIGLLRKKERSEYSTGVARKRGAKVTIILSHHVWHFSTLNNRQSQAPFGTFTLNLAHR